MNRRIAARSSASQIDSLTNATSSASVNEVATHTTLGSNQSHTPTTPYSGDYNGCAWNAQALLAAKASKQGTKLDHLGKLVCLHDFVGVEETHRTEGKTIAARMPRGCKTSWSNLSSQQAGIGLVVQKGFLSKFAATNDSSWTELEYGRLGKLKLRGLAGALDIIVAYMAIGLGLQADRAARLRSYKILKENIAPREEVLTILLGDWNWVAEDRDRWCFESKSWTGSRDREEAKCFSDLVLTPAGLHELHQSEPTCSVGQAVSRIDRVYVNHHASEYLDRQFACSVMGRTPLSAHRPLTFKKVMPKTGDIDELPTSPIPNACIRNPDWARRVAAELQTLSIAPADFTNPIRRLVLTKRAMHNVSANMAREDKPTMATTAEEKLGCILSFLRAANEVKIIKMQRKASELPEISKHVDPKNPNAKYEPGFTILQDLAVSIARQKVTEEIQSLVNGESDPSSHMHQQRKQNVLRCLRRLLPGSTTGIGAMQLHDGQTVTSAASIATALRDHWKNVFGKKDIDDALLAHWLHSLPQLSRHQDQPHIATETNMSSISGPQDPAVKLGGPSLAQGKRECVCPRSRTNGASAEKMCKMRFSTVATLPGWHSFRCMARPWPIGDDDSVRSRRCIGERGQQLFTQ